MMTKRVRCAFCAELAVAYRLERDGAKTPICAYHIPTREGEPLPTLHTPPDGDQPAPSDTGGTDQPQTRH
jgi:hypothetical protein